MKALSEQTRRDNSAFFPDGEDVPRLCVTQGLGTICDADHLLLIATGARKARALAAAVEGPVSARCPASVVQLHRTVTVVVDEAAAVELEFTSCYREAFSAATIRA